MVNYQEARAKLTNTQLTKLKFVAKEVTGTILLINKKHFVDEELPHELFITTRQTTKIRNSFGNSMSKNVSKFSNSQISKMIQSAESFGFWLINLRKQFNCNKMK